MVIMVFVRLGVGCKSTIGEGFKNKIVLHSFREMKCNQAYTPGIFHDVYKILGLRVLMTVSSLAFSFEEYDRDSVCFPIFCLSICYSILILGTLS